MTRESGYSVVELLVASAILLTVSGAVLTLLHDGLAATPVLEETTDLHQRARVTADVLGADLRAAAGGTASGALSRYIASVDPRRPTDPPGTTSPSAVIVRYVVPRGAHGRLAQPLDPGGAAAIIVGSSGCPLNTIACGFTAGTRAVVFDTSGFSDFLEIDAIGPGVLSISGPAGGRSTTYPTGAEIAEAVEVAYFFDPASRQLRRQEGSATFVVADNVNAVAFEYLAYDLVQLPLGTFEDGPFTGAGATAFDADLLRVRAVRATVRVETGIAAMRGTDVRRFARPGTATGRRVIPDIVWRVDVSLRNAGS
jgi:hypothetical protein